MQAVSRDNNNGLTFENLSDEMIFEILSHTLKNGNNISGQALASFSQTNKKNNRIAHLARDSIIIAQKAVEACGFIVNGDVFKGFYNKFSLFNKRIFSYNIRSSKLQKNYLNKLTIETINLIEKNLTSEQMHNPIIAQLLSEFYIKCGFLANARMHALNAVTQGNQSSRFILCHLNGMKNPYEKENEILYNFIFNALGINSEQLDVSIRKNICLFISKNALYFSSNTRDYLQKFCELYHNHTNFFTIMLDSLEILGKILYCENYKNIIHSFNKDQILKLNEQNFFDFLLFKHNPNDTEKFCIRKILEAKCVLHPNINYSKAIKHLALLDETDRDIILGRINNCTRMKNNQAMINNGFDYFSIDPKTLCTKNILILLEHAYISLALFKRFNEQKKLLLKNHSADIIKKLNPTENLHLKIKKRKARLLDLLETMIEEQDKLKISPLKQINLIRNNENEIYKQFSRTFCATQKNPLIWRKRLGEENLELNNNGPKRLKANDNYIVHEQSYNFIPKLS